MRLRVVWTLAAEKSLTEVWLASRRRSQVTNAANRLDELLATDPFSISESRIEGLRVTFEPLLGALFTVSVEASTVRVLSVWEF